MAAPEPWHLDRRVPLALILTIALQTAGAVWWASALSSQVQNHERRIDVAEKVISRHADDDKRMSELLGRMDERMAAVQRSVEDRMTAIQRSIDQLTRALPPARSN